MISVKVTFIGMERAQAWLASAPGRFQHALEESTKHGVELEKEAIEQRTTRVTGSLASSIQTQVRKTVEGSEGKVYTDLRYARFVELGTRKHGRAQHMFRHGGKQAAPEVKELFKNSVNRIAGSF